MLPVLTVQSSSGDTIDFQVGIILDLRSRDSPVGQIGMSCLSMAYSDFYSLHRDYKTRLVLHVRDSNGSVVDAAAAALHLIQDVKVDAIIGPQKSLQANFVMDLGDRARIPIISFSATSPSLIPQTSYFVQTAQSDADQVQAIASIAEAFQSAFPKSASDDVITKELYKMMSMQTRVFVVHTSQSLGTRVFLKAKEIGMMSEGYAWIVTSGLTDLFNMVDSDVAEAMQGVLGVKPLIPKSKELQSFTSRLIRMFLQADDLDIKPADASVFGLWAYDTLSALAMAAERVGNNGTTSMKNKANVDPRCTFALGISETGPKLLQELLATRFKGLAGEFNLVNGQLKQTPYQIVNIVERAERDVGIWKPSAEVSRITFRTIIWPGDSKVAPRGWEFPANGKKLRIGVPQKPGFNEFLKVETDPSTNRTEVRGYYKDIFDSVMATLPYAIPHEYVPYPFYNPDGSQAGSYNDLVYEVSLQEKYDAAFGDITITANRSIYADFSLPYAEGGVTSIVPIKYEDAHNVFTFLKPLTKELWLTTAIFYFATALAIWILGSRSITASRDSPGQHAGIICYFPFFPGEGIRGSLLCLVLVSWASVANLLNSTYTASLSSRLTVQKLQPTVTDVVQLITNGDYVGCQQGSFLVGFLKNLGFKESRIRTYNSSEDCDKALMLGSKNGGISAYYDVLPHIRILLSRYCGKYMMVGPTYRTDGFAFAFPKGSPAVADISRAIINLTENGIIKEFEQQLSDNSACTVPDNNSSPTSVTLRSFWVLFLITGCVMVTCLLVSQFMYLSKNRPFLQRMSDFKAKILSRADAWSKYLKKSNPSSLPKTTSTGDQLPRS
ncbi:Glutamate-gated kainate-type ion channel receptor subunit GluR5 [Handroanthus impetiginosus]|uniref:Glutamate receptor n=1 Tax=Handroanthus impetiginosus TaxID=429701 RepID=A0A2G9HWV8_9LAMI|nr:Glutamate-gated kainate-type ion channel receptor subunit GluR5 [Handroanthus impetiginosus]